MKLKLIKDSEVVVSKTEYELLKIVNSQTEDLIKAIRCCKKCVYFIDNSSYFPIVKVTYNGASLPIKRFASDDPCYARVCAEELVELLNQEQ